MAIVKLIVTDLDDTLLKNDKTISDYTKSVINEIRTAGVKFAFSTARGESVKNIIQEGFFDAYSLLNGAIGFAEGLCIFKNLIEPEVYIPFLKDLHDNSILVGAEVDGCHYTNYNAKAKWNNIGKNVITTFDDSIDGSAGKLYAILNQKTDLDTIRELLPRGLYIKVSRDGLVMIMNVNATKANTLESLAEYYHVSMDEVIAFGDDINDIDMLKIAGTGVAMGNAVPEVRMIADEICGNNEEDGLAKWIANNLLR